MLIVCHIFACSLLGTSLEEEMENALIVFFCLHWIDIATRILGLGVKDFWNASRHPFEQITNRFGSQRRPGPRAGARPPTQPRSRRPHMVGLLPATAAWLPPLVDPCVDLGVMVVAVLVVVGELFARTSRDAERGTLFRFGLAIPIIRVFGAIGTSRRVVFGLASILPGTWFYRAWPRVWPGPSARPNPFAPHPAQCFLPSSASWSACSTGLPSSAACPSVAPCRAFRPQSTRTPRWVCCTRTGGELRLAPRRLPPPSPAPPARPDGQLRLLRRRDRHAGATIGGVGEHTHTGHH